MRHHAGPVAFVAACLLTLTACAGSSNADAVNGDGSVDLSKVTLVVGDQKGGSKVLLTAAGVLDDLPYEVEFKPFASGPPLLEAIGSGAVDVGYVGNTPPLFAIDQGKKVKVIAANDQGVAGDTIVVPKGSDLSEVSQLRGKKVAVAKGSSGHYHLIAQLRAVGLGLDDVEPVWLQPTEALSALRGGSIDAWATWDPLTAQAELGSGARILTDGAGLSNGLFFEVAGDEALEDEATRAALRDYVGRLAAARVWVEGHRDVWARTLAKETGLPREVTARTAERRSFEPVAVDASTIASEQQVWDAFAEQGQVSGDPDLRSYFVDDFNEDVLGAVAEAERP